MNQHAFEGLSEDEQELTRFAYQQVAKKILDRAAADDYDKADLAGAAATFHMASLLASGVGVLLGEPAPDLESLEIVTTCIALGEAPLAAASGEMAHAMVTEAARSLGASADVPVTPEEDECGCDCSADERCDYTAPEYDGLSPNEHP